MVENRQSNHSASPATFPAAFPGCRRGDHVCLPYQSEDDREDALAGYLREGLVKGERCIVVAPPVALGRLDAALRTAGVDVARLDRSGSLRFLTSDDVYGTGDGLDAGRTIDLIQHSLVEALGDGFTGLRGFGDLGMAIEGPALAVARDYEHRLNTDLAGKPFTGMCGYARALVPDGVLDELFRLHPGACIAGQRSDNPFFDEDRASATLAAAATEPGAGGARLGTPFMLAAIEARRAEARLAGQSLDLLVARAAAAMRGRDELQAQATEAARAMRDELRALREQLRDHSVPSPTALMEHAERALAVLRELDHRTRTVGDDDNPPGRPAQDW